MEQKGQIRARLYLVQHGEATSPEVDTNRPLTGKGREEVAATAAFIKGSGPQIDEVWHSSKLRARQTADIITAALGITKESKEKKFINPNDPVAPVAEVINMHDKNILIAGHLPFLARLASLLLTGAENGTPVTFRQGGAACLEKREAGWTLSPARSNL